jgi:molecular chaperone HscC
MRDYTRAAPARRIARAAHGIEIRTTDRIRFLAYSSGLISMIVGIDLGTTNSLVGVWRDGQAHLVQNPLGQVLTPSVVGVDDSGEILVGEGARERLITHPNLTCGAFKRYMGSTRIAALGTHRFRPEELSALVLRTLKADAEAFLGEPVTEAVITVPAYFNDAQRKATRVAGELAGLKVERLLNEPTAAALAYGLHDADAESRVIVLDLGGGTFDVSVLEWFEGVMEVHASAGDNFLGGEDFVDALVNDFLRQRAPAAWRDDESPAFRSRLRSAATQLMHTLSLQPQASARVLRGEEAVDWSVNAGDFELIATPLLDRLRAPIERALRDARFRLSEVNQLLLVGGATRMPIVRQAMTRLFGRFPASQIDPDRAIALGAAVQAGLKAHDRALDDIVLTDVCPYSLGTEVSRKIGPNQFEHGLFNPIIERNTLVPASRVSNFVTLTDRQAVVHLPVYQGENRLVRNNVFLGEVRIDVPPRPAGEISVDVRFTYDVDGLLEVDVEVPETGQRRQLVIEGREHSYTPEQIAARREYLAGLKHHPRDQTENRTLLARAERLYEENLGHAREYLQQCISAFVAALETQDPHLIARERREFVHRLARVENNPLA